VLLSYTCQIEHQMVGRCVYLLINGATYFGTNCWPSSGSPQIFWRVHCVCQLVWRI
jgi:hypothetical protein